MRQNYNREELEQAAKSSVSYRSCTIALGRNPHGGNIDYVKNLLSREGIDTSHFLGQRWCLGKHPPNGQKKSSSDILQKGGRPKAHQLRRSLVDVGVLYQCSGCGLSSWRDRDLPLEVHHIDGDTTNNLKENLEFICPNCHSQTDGYRYKGKGKKKMNEPKSFF